MGRVQPSTIPQYQSTCDGAPHKFCYLIHNPCLNGGVCVGFCPDIGKRFECQCQPCYYGYRCQAHLPSTCQDYLTIPKPTNGMYIVFNENNATIKVYCDFNSEKGLAWTLILSRDLNQVVGPFWNAFSGWSDNLPEIVWSKYRLPRTTVVHLSEKSTHWRATCEYEKLGVDYVDYLRSKLDVTNPLTYDHRDIAQSMECRLVEYVDIRGQHCTDCTVLLGQGANCVMYSQEPFSTSYGCDFGGSFSTSDCPPWAVKKKEFYFGCYNSGCRTGKHRCNERTESTTQIWFGG